MTYRAGQHGITPFCRGDADTWYVLSSEDGHNWGRCSPADSFPVAPNLLTLGPYPDAYPAVKGRFRMFVTKPPQDWIDCNRAGHSGGVEPVLPPSQPLDSTDAQFGFVVDEHEPHQPFSRRWGHRSRRWSRQSSRGIPGQKGRSRSKRRVHSGGPARRPRSRQHRGCLHDPDPGDETVS